VADARSPLAGKTVLVTRAREQASDLCRALDARGAQALVIPMVRFALPADTAQMDRALQELRQFDWWLLTSRNAVQFAAERARTLGIELRSAASSVKIAAIGSATAAVAEANGLAVHYRAEIHSGESLAEGLAGELRGQRVLVLRSDLADQTLPVRLARRGAQVTEGVAYRTLPAPDRQALLTLDWNTVSAAIFFSPSALRYFLEALGAERAHDLCDRMPLVAIGPTTAAAIRETGFPRVLQAGAATSAAAVEMLEKHIAENSENHVARMEQS
jgi:uroporphyrinogen-III synthase